MFVLIMRSSLPPKSVYSCVRNKRVEGGLFFFFISHREVQSQQPPPQQPCPNDDAHEVQESENAYKRIFTKAGASFCALFHYRASLHLL